MSGNKPSPWFRMLALCTALGLGGTYVWRQQQQAAPQIDKPVQRTILSGSKSRIIAPSALSMDHEETDRVLLPGPKSAGVFSPEQERTLMKSSKSGIIELNPGETKDRVLMPGSKSFIVIPEKPETTPPPAQPKADKP
jgi:hypothetical protein